MKFKKGDLIFHKRLEVLLEIIDVESYNYRIYIVSDKRYVWLEKDYIEESCYGVTTDEAMVELL